ncbi:hypothetical protein [Aquamicrobium sp.]|uniref:hypothetical protein n=1 Tax=Aquamicrobium sp. TaxID=1872579 RepID=UPI00258A5984|nr:hypothetical protein [Aquamicrobium sp.]MCK9550885.1 hypothetical protein [Aquamicrobium sp.]
MSYALHNQIGRQRAQRIIEECAATDNMPRLVNEIRKAAADESGFGVGFMYAIAQLVAARAS